jgi:hypothetical protein
MSINGIENATSAGDSFGQPHARIQRRAHRRVPRCGNWKIRQAKAPALLGQSPEGPGQREALMAAPHLASQRRQRRRCSYAERPLIRGSLCCRADTPLSILVERVRKPTDNRSAQMFRCLAADADSLRAIGWSLAPAHPPYPSRAGVNEYFDRASRSGSPIPLLTALPLHRDAGGIADLAGRRRKRFIAGLKELQVCLGDLNDIVVNQRISASLVNSATTGERDNNAAWKAFAAGRLCGREEARFSSVMKAATQAHKVFAGAERFWN